MPTVVSWGVLYPISSLLLTTPAAAPLGGRIDMPYFTKARRLPTQSLAEARLTSPNTAVHFC